MNRKCPTMDYSTLQGAFYLTLGDKIGIPNLKLHYLLSLFTITDGYVRMKDEVYSSLDVSFV